MVLGDRGIRDRLEPRWSCQRPSPSRYCRWSCRGRSLARRSHAQRRTEETERLLAKRIASAPPLSVARRGPWPCRSLGTFGNDCNVKKSRIRAAVNLAAPKTDQLTKNARWLALFPGPRPAGRARYTIWRWRVLRNRRRLAQRGEPPHMKVGRNDPCPCGSGKKYKNCCLARAEHRSTPEGDGLATALARLQQHRTAVGAT